MFASQHAGHVTPCAGIKRGDPALETREQLPQRGSSHLSGRSRGPRDRHGSSRLLPATAPVHGASGALAGADVRAADDGHGRHGRAAAVLGGEGRKSREEAAVHGGADTVAGVHLPRAPRQARAPGEGGAGAGAGPAAAPGRHLVPEQARAVAHQAARARLRRPPRKVRRPPLPRRLPQARQAHPRRTGTRAKREAEGARRRRRRRDDRHCQQQQLQRRRRGAGRRQEQRRRPRPVHHRRRAPRELRARRDHAGGHLGGVRVRRRPPPLRRRCSRVPVRVLLRHAGALGTVAMAARRVECGGLKRSS